MEASLFVVIESATPELTQFIELMLDDEKAPVESDEVDEDFKDAFSALEFTESPTSKTRLNDFRLSIFFDVIGVGDFFDCVDDYIQPYIDAGAKKMFLAYCADEGVEWYVVDRSGIKGVPETEKYFSPGDDWSIEECLNSLADRFS